MVILNQNKERLRARRVKKTLSAQLKGKVKVPVSVFRFDLEFLIHPKDQNPNLIQYQISYKTEIKMAVVIQNDDDKKRIEWVKKSHLSEVKSCEVRWSVFQSAECEICRNRERARIGSRKISSKVGFDLLLNILPMAVEAGLSLQSWFVEFSAMPPSQRPRASAADSLDFVHLVVRIVRFVLFCPRRRRGGIRRWLWFLEDLDLVLVLIWGLKKNRENKRSIHRKPLLLTFIFEWLHCWFWCLYYRLLFGDFQLISLHWKIQRRLVPIQAELQKRGLK